MFYPDSRSPRLKPPQIFTPEWISLTLALSITARLATSVQSHRHCITANRCAFLSTIRFSARNHTNKFCRITINFTIITVTVMSLPPCNSYSSECSSKTNLCNRLKHIARPWVSRNRIWIFNKTLVDICISCSKN